MSDPTNAEWAKHLLNQGLTGVSLPHDSDETQYLGLIAEAQVYATLAVADTLNEILIEMQTRGAR